MIYELRTYTLRAGTGPAVAKNAGEVGRAIRGDDYGKLEGYWLTEIGPLNQVMHLWSYADLNDRHRLRGELAKNERWAKEYIPLVREHLVRQDIRLLDPILALKAPESEGNIYEYRNYRTAPGRVREWAKHFPGHHADARGVLEERRRLDHRGGDSRTRSRTCGPIHPWTHAPNAGPRSPRIRAGRSSWERRGRSSRRCTRRSCCRPPTRRSSRASWSGAKGIREEASRCA